MRISVHLLPYVTVHTLHEAITSITNTKYEMIIEDNDLICINIDTDAVTAIKIRDILGPSRHIVLVDRAYTEFDVGYYVRNFTGRNVNPTDVYTPANNKYPIRKISESLIEVTLPIDIMKYHCIKIGHRINSDYLE